jgi:aminomethyltransferase
LTPPEGGTMMGRGGEGDNNVTASNLKKTPLNRWHHEHGAKMMDFGGWDMPVQYEAGILKEHLATRRYGGLFDVSHMGRFRFKGPDRIAFLQRVLSNNAEALRPWKAHYTLIPNEAGGLVDDAYLYRFGEDDYLLVVNASNAEKDWNHFRVEARAFPGLVMEDHSEQVAMIAFQGPLSGRILEELIEDGALPKPFRNSLAEVTLAGAKVLIGRTGYTAEPICFELFVPAERAEAIWSRLLEAGRERGVVPVGLGARDTLRLEGGLPLYGHEFGIDAEGREIPAFAFPLTSIAVSFSERKGASIGREALLAQYAEVKKLKEGAYRPSDRLPRRILPVAIEGKGVARQGDRVLVGDEQVGFVTSGTVAPYWKIEGSGSISNITDAAERRAVALALVDARLEPEQKVDVLVRERRLAARVVKCHGRSEAPPWFRPIPSGWRRPLRAPAVGEGLEKTRQLLRKALDNHEWRQRRCVNLIPSEMTPSPLVRMLQVSDPVGRYAEHREFPAFLDQEVFYYQGTDFIAWVEDRLAAEFAAYLGCPLVEARALSGQMANMTVFSAMVSWRNRANLRAEPGRIALAMTNHITYGGHLSAQPMGALRDYIARDPVTERFAVVNFPMRRDNPYRVDLEETAKILDQAKPELVVFGKSMVIHREPVAEVKALLDQRGQRPILMYDMAHVLGLVGPHFQEPFKEGADVVTGSTHKTYFGTQRGVIGMSFEEGTPGWDLWGAVQRRAFPGMTSNHHLGTMLGLLLAAIEMNAFKGEYQPQVVANAKAFARALKRQGVDVAGDPEIGFTETHQVIVRVGYANGCQIARDLERNNIVVNYQAIPTDESFTASSGIRIGVSEMTRFGMKQGDFEELAPLLAEALKGKDVGDDVARFRQRFLTMRYCFDGAELEEQRAKLLATF